MVQIENAHKVYNTTTASAKRKKRKTETTNVAGEVRALDGVSTIILADEPTANLDSKTSLQILELMQSLNEKHGTTFVFSIHDQSVMEHCRRIIRLKDGRIVEDRCKVRQA